MEALTNLLNSVIGANKNKIINTSIRKNRSEVIDLNTKNQLLQGIDSTGDVFGLYRSVGYSLLKQRVPGREASFGVVDLRLTGKFYKTFFVTANNQDDFFSIDADTIKDDTDLAKKYGPDIIGLTEESRDKLGIKITPTIIEAYKREIGII